MFLSSSNLVPYLIERGVISAIDRDFSIVETARRHRNFKLIRRSHPGLFIKQVRSLESGLVMGLEREAACMHWAGVQPECAAVDRLMPRIIDYDPDGHVLVQELLASAENLTEYHRRIGKLPLTVARLLGNGLATLHALSERSPGTGDQTTFPRQIPRVFFPHLLGWVARPEVLRRAWGETWGAFHALRSTSGRATGPPATSAGGQLLSWLQHCPELLWRVDELRRWWRCECLMHGDMRWENCLVIENEHGELELRIVDWEHVDMGDPCWDVAGVIQSYIVHALTSLTVSPEVTPEQFTACLTQRFEALRPALNEFWNTYVADLKLEAESARRTLDRAVRYAAARLVQSAFEHAHCGQEFLALAVTMLRTSLVLLRAPDAAVAQLLGSDNSFLLSASRPGTGNHWQTHEALAAIVGAIKILSPQAFQFAGGPIVDGQSFDQLSLGQPGRPFPADPLVRALMRTIYDHGYARPFDATRPPTFPAPVRDADPAFTARLEQANRSRAGRDRLQVPESCEPQTGFCFAYGDTRAINSPEDGTIRVYFHSTANGAPMLVEFLTTELNRFQVPFRIKCLSHPLSYHRADAVVLYVARGCFSTIAGLLANMNEALIAEMQAAVPLFTKELRAGVGLAEDPANGESFGQSRCRLVAEGMVDAWRQSLQTLTATLSTIRARFSMSGLDLDRPYLNPGSADVFEIPA